MVSTQRSLEALRFIVEDCYNKADVIKHAPCKMTFYVTCCGDMKVKCGESLHALFY